MYYVEVETNPEYDSHFHPVPCDRMVKLDRGTEIEADASEVRFAKEEGISYSLLARYAWLKAKYPANISEAQKREYSVLCNLIIPDVDFPEGYIDKYCYVGYLAYISGYTWEDWCEELENNFDFKL